MYKFHKIIGLALTIIFNCKLIYFNYSFIILGVNHIYVYFIVILSKKISRQMTKKKLIKKHIFF